MTNDKIMQIFDDTAYVRTGGSPEELRCAGYLAEKCKEFGVSAKIWPFKVDMADMKKAELYVDGEKIQCKGYLLCGTSQVEAPIFYLRNQDKYSLSECRGKIVMIDGYLGYWVYHDIRQS